MRWFIGSILLVLSVGSGVVFGSTIVRFFHLEPWVQEVAHPESITQDNAAQTQPNKSIPSASLSPQQPAQSPTVNTTPLSGLEGLPQHYGLFAYFEGRSYDFDNPKEMKIWFFPPGARALPDFILFNPNAQAGIDRVHLVRFRFVDRLITFDKSDFSNPKQKIQKVGQWHAVMCSGDGSLEIPMQVGPVNGNAQMLQFSPKNFPVEPGYYGIFIGSGERDCSMSWVPRVNFSQGPPTAGSGSEVVIFIIGTPDERTDCVYLQYGNGKGGWDGYLQGLDGQFQSFRCDRNSAGGADATPP